jgi:cell division protein FtsB
MSGFMSSGPANSSSTPVESGWFVSLLFWLALLLAALLYGAVALSPKYMAWLETRREYHDGQVRLVALERQVGYLERVVSALESDPQFAAELARVDFDACRPGEEQIPVDARLSLDGLVKETHAVRAARLPWYTPLVAQAAENEPLRRNLLIAAASMVLFAFTFLHESRDPQIRSTARRVQQGTRSMFAGVTWLVARYRKPAA